MEEYVEKQTTEGSVGIQPSADLDGLLTTSGLGAGAEAAGGVAAPGSAPLEVRDWRGRTPLHTACAVGRAEVVRALLAGGANENAEDRDG